MRNEIITDNIVRDFFKQYSDDIIIEQQSSSNPSIDKLLRTASKKGDGKGYPDFIIQYQKDKNFIIVIEDKADKRYHESETHKQYDKYAVDGVLLYASFLSKSYDVLAIAISGTNKDDLKISHYLHLKDEPKAFSYFGGTLLSPTNYYNGLNSSEEKKRQDYDKLLDYTRILNTRLHSMKIDEAERCILASCILLALRLPHFKSYYSNEDNQTILANRMINDVMDWLEKEKVGTKKIEIIKSKYATIRGMFAQESKQNSLRDLIADMAINIDEFEETNRYYDVLGQLYVAFLRYANTSNDLGVVLTPTHITDFFAEIAEVNKDSVVFDNCTGTCGFLIAAMSKMVKDANGNPDAEDSIRKNQLIGIEKGDKMFCLAASNMAIHGDGKTNIYHESGLDAKIIAEIKNGIKDVKTGKVYKPTVGFLNPPYKADKKNDVEELEFVKWNLEALVEGGTCVAIVPMQCAIAGTKSKKIYELKKELLSKHTLEAVFSMPDELFYNSDKSVVTCIMVFKAHKPHPENRETFFGYFKDDGFEKRKKLGRIDVHSKWSSIKREWLYLYQKRKEVVGKSVVQSVTAKDEWCAEAYMETDYRNLSNIDFINDLCATSTFLLRNSDYFIPKTYTNIPLLEIDTSFDISKWKSFALIPQLFDFSRGKRLTKADSIEGNTFLVTAGEENQGVKRSVDNDMDIYSNCITIDMFGYCVYRGYEFCCDDNILVLTPNQVISKYALMFIVTIINQDKYKFAYGRQYRQKTLLKHKIKLPADSSGNPDWEFMENYIKSLPYSANI
ncbi:MAG: N-6 DNA methylase [Alistipes sp.]|nr:N-6 DNA methylase [Alistipes sp.]